MADIWCLYIACTHNHVPPPSIPESCQVFSSSAVVRSHTPISHRPSKLPPNKGGWARTIVSCFDNAVVSRILRLISHHDNNVDTLFIFPLTLSFCVLCHEKVPSYRFVQPCPVAAERKQYPSLSSSTACDRCETLGTMKLASGFRFSLFFFFSFLVARSDPSLIVLTVSSGLDDISELIHKSIGIAVTIELLIPSTLIDVLVLRPVSYTHLTLPTSDLV